MNAYCMLIWLQTLLSQYLNEWQYILKNKALSHIKTDKWRWTQFILPVQIMSNQMDSKMQSTGKRKNNNNWAINAQS